MSTRSAGCFSRRTASFREDPSSPLPHEVWGRREHRPKAEGRSGAGGLEARTKEMRSRGSPPLRRRDKETVVPRRSPDARSPEGVRLSPHPLGALSQDGFRHLDVPSASACTATVGWLGSFVLRFDPSLVGRCPSAHSPRAPLEHHPALRRSGATRRDLGGPDGHWRPSPRSETPIQACNRSRSPGDPSDRSMQRSPLASPVSPKARRPSPLPAEAVRVSGNLRDRSGLCQPIRLISFRVLDRVFPF